MKITWTHDSSEIPWPPSFEQKVDIFYHRHLGWQLHVADLVSNGGDPLSHGDAVTPLPAVPHSGFAVLQICLSYFETIAQYQRINAKTTRPGDFFREVPRGADGYVMKHILHDWSDEHARSILTNIHHAAKPGAPRAWSPHTFG